MKKATLVAFSTMFFVFALAVSSSFGSEKAQEVTVEGNVICLIPDYEKGTVNPVIANEPCSGEAPHSHILVGKDGKVYNLQGLQEGLMKIQAAPNHTGVKIAGKVEQTPGGWILYVN